MKQILFSVTFGLSGAMSFGQTVEFFPAEVRGLEKTFSLSGTAGQSTQAKNLWLHNRTAQTLRVYARPHVEYGALYFTNGSKTSHDFSLQLAPGVKGALQLFGYLMDSATARNCAGYLALAATPVNADGSDGTTRTVKLPVAVNFKGPQALPGRKPAPPVGAARWNKPDRYEAVMQEGLPMRRHLRHLPLKVYSDHVHTGDTATQYALVMRRAVEVWNAVGRENGLDRDFFKIVEQSGGADIRVDWTGKRLLPNSQGTAYPSDGLIGMMPLGRYGGSGNAAETLLQELCHMLGVSHSEMRADIMFPGAHTHNPDLAKLTVTARDKQMLDWLYQQTRYAPLKE